MTLSDCDHEPLPPMGQCACGHYSVEDPPMTSKLTITCNGCGKEISKQVPAQYLMLSASYAGLLLEPKHFCNHACLRAWGNSIAGWMPPVRAENEDL